MHEYCKKKAPVFSIPHSNSISNFVHWLCLAQYIMLGPDPTHATDCRGCKFPWLISSTIPSPPHGVESSYRNRARMKNRWFGHDRLTKWEEFEGWWKHSSYLFLWWLLSSCCFYYDYFGGLSFDCSRYCCCSSGYGCGHERQRFNDR
jgi:hypothetical protein